MTRLARGTGAGLAKDRTMSKVSKRTLYLWSNTEDSLNAWATEELVRLLNRYPLSPIGLVAGRTDTTSPKMARLLLAYCWGADEFVGRRD